MICAGWPEDRVGINHGGAPHSCSVHNPLLADRAATGRKDEWGPVCRDSAADVDAFAADADERPVDDCPVLTRSAGAGYIHDLRAIDRFAPLNVDAEAAYSGHLAVIQKPLLISPRIAGFQAQRCTCNRKSMVLNVHALIAVSAGYL